MKSFDHGSTKQHQELGKDFRLAVGEKFDDVVIIPYAVGMFRDFDSAERIIHAGQAFVPDWIVFGCGWYLFFDSKTGHATFSKGQKAFKNRISEINGGTEHVYKLRTVEEGLRVIDTAREYYKNIFRSIRAK